MKYYTISDPRYEYGSRQVVETGEGVLVDLSYRRQGLDDVSDLVSRAASRNLSVDDATRQYLQRSAQREYNLSEIVLPANDDLDHENWDDEDWDDEDSLKMYKPFDPPEVWAAGVTYKTSEMERRRESGTPDVYSMVYSAERPEVFFKATPERCVGQFDSVGIRADSGWNVPEPELAFVLYGGEIVGYTIGNDMSSRQIEGENPLYLPQAKVFNRCCAIGPCFVSAESIGDPHSLDVNCAITRDGKEVFSGSTNTSQMARTCQELADWLQRHNNVPDMTVVLTGTSIVPPPDFTLQEGDSVSITIEGIGTLVNDVIVV